MNTLRFTLILLFFNTVVNAQEVDSFALYLEQYRYYADSIEKTLNYERGTVSIADGIATMNVPEGYKYLSAEQSAFVLFDLWGNPPSEVHGMLLPENTSPLSDTFTYAVEITYEEEGYINDEDAQDIDYNDLLETMKEDAAEFNEFREENGYERMYMEGWAAEPFYDHVNKKLHWAKEFRVEGSDINTLNYNIRVLGRRGVLTLNAIGDMDVLPLVQTDIDDILKSVNFNPGHAYSDFNPDIDKVAAYGIGGLIAGKVLAKAGFFALLLKFWKVIAVGAVALFAGIRKFLSKDSMS